MTHAAESERPDIQQLERALLAHHGVVDAAIISRPGPSGAEVLLGFVVSSNPGQEQRLLNDLPELKAQNITLVPLGALPYAEDGAVDREHLATVGVVDADAANRIALELRARRDVAHATVLVEPARILPQRLHNSDLVADVAEEVAAEVEAAPEPPSPAASASPRQALVQAPSLHLEAAARSLGEALLSAARACSDPRITYVADDGAETRQTFGQLLDEAERTLAGLRARGIQPGAYVIFQLEAPRNIVPTFWGCLLGGFVPVICPVPSSYDAQTNDLDKLLHVWRLLGEPQIVSESARSAGLPALNAHLQLGDGAVPVVEELRQAQPDRAHHVAAPSDVAFLSLTSGSTGTPKCIALTHANILSRGRGTNVMCDHDETDVILNWLPFDHIGSISDWHARCVDLRCHMVYCSKERVLGNLLNWLDLIARFRITHSWAPNFAYALINAALDGAAGQTWDLACMKSLLTAGEAVSSATVEEFLTRLARFGLARSAVRPAFGMAELGSGITYFRPTAQQPYAAFSVDRQSLTGTLVTLPKEHPRSIVFTGLGTVIAGMSMRIVDDAGAVMPENVIGNLHVKGEAVTPGYVNNPEANAKVFVGDGWFDTGDRGFIANAQLFLTGRSKDTIIVNGANYYPGELESAAEQVPEVLVSFTAACTVRPPGARAERVALFLSTNLLPERQQADVLREVQSKVSKKIGVKPDYLIPLTRDRIPKTAIGKIQRKELVRRFEDGEFDDIVRDVDCLLENDNTLRNWFSRPVWRAVALRGAPEANTASDALLVLGDADGSAQMLCTELGRPHLRLTRGTEFAMHSSEHWSLDWGNSNQVQLLCKELANRKPLSSGLLDLNGLGPQAPADDAASLKQRIQSDCIDTLTLLQGLHTAALLPTRYWAFASAAQPVLPNDVPAAGRALFIPLLKALEQAIEGFSLRHIDVPAGLSQAALTSLVRAELREPGKHTEIAYRGGRRLVASLEVVPWQSAQRAAHPLLDAAGPRGFCLITGGLGGLGVLLAKQLLRRGVPVLLIGRRALDAMAGSRTGSVELAELERLGRVQYRQADVTNLAEVEHAVAATAEQWQAPLAGVLHLAGAAREAPILDESAQTLWGVLAPKVLGGWALDRVLERYPSAFCVLFSSAATTIGTSQTGAYAMANAYLDGLAHVQRGRGRLTHVLNWSPWEGVGMNAGMAASAALRAKGLETIGARAGINSLLASLSLSSPRSIIGLNPDHPRVAFLTGQATQTRTLRGYVVRRAHSEEIALPTEWHTLDRFGQRIDAQLLELSRLPLTADGSVDDAALQATVSGTAREKTKPRNATEQLLVQVFSNVLGLDDVGVNESFFDLGGTSLLSLRLFGEIERHLGVRLPAATLLEAATIEQLALRLGATKPTATQDCLVQITPPGKGPAMFLVHDADGETILYRTLAGALNGTGVFGLKPFGSERFPALHTSIDEMSEHYIRRIRDVQPQGPYLLGGMCAGGVIAFDIACRLQEMGQPVALVALLDAADSRAPRLGSNTQRASRFAALFENNKDLRATLLEASGKVRNLVRHEINRRYTRAMNNAKLFALRELQRREVRLPSVLQGIAPRTVYEFAQERHEPRRFNGKLLLLRATHADAQQEANGITDTPAIETTSDQQLGWGQRATQGVEVVDVPGGHSSMLQEPNVATLADILRKHIRTALGA